MSNNIYQESPPVCLRSGCENPAKMRYDKKWAKHCSKSCQGADASTKGLSKRKETCLEKYGVENPVQSKEIQQKIKNTCVEKYGSSCPLNSVSVKQKIKNVLIERYGVENPMQNKEIKEKADSTILNRYGVSNISQNENIKEKKKQTLLNNFGVTNPSHSEEIREKRRTTQENNGTISPRSQITEKEAYYREVARVTENSYKDHIDKINPDLLPRGRFSYHLDHKISRHEGFKTEIPASDIGHYSNLEMLPWKDNLVKSRNSKHL